MEYSQSHPKFRRSRRKANDSSVSSNKYFL